MMQSVRSSLLSRVFAMITALVFMNMSLIIAEVYALKLDKDKELIENIAKMISGCSSEEETDGVKGLADEDVKVKEIDLMHHSHLTLPLSEILDGPHKIRLQNSGIPRFGNYEIYCPPPESIIIS